MTRSHSFLWVRYKSVRWIRKRTGPFLAVPLPKIWQHKVPSFPNSMIEFWNGSMRLYKTTSQLVSHSFRVFVFVPNWTSRRRATCNTWCIRKKVFFSVVVRIQQDFCFDSVAHKWTGGLTDWLTWGIRIASVNFRCIRRLIAEQQYFVRAMANHNTDTWEKQKRTEAKAVECHGQIGWNANYSILYMRKNTDVRAWFCDPWRLLETFAGARHFFSPGIMWTMWTSQHYSRIVGRICLDRQQQPPEYISPPPPRTNAHCKNVSTKCFCCCCK